MDAMGHRVLGNFYDAVLSDDMEVTNLAGYHSVGNWHATRTPQDPGSGVSPELLKLFQDSIRERHALTRTTWVQVMNAHWPGVGWRRDESPIRRSPRSEASA